MNTERLLPIGSVVLLKESEKELMIIGIMPKSNDKQYDYIAVLHPEGYLNDKIIFTFNHEDIAKVSYLGYMNAAYQMFRSEVVGVMQQQEG